MAADDPFGLLITYNLPEEIVESSSGEMYVVSGFTGVARSNETYG
jgi:hypothetical protein